MTWPSYLVLSLAFAGIGVVHFYAYAVSQVIEVVFVPFVVRGGPP